MANVAKKLNLESISELFKTVKATTAATLNSSPFISHTSRLREQAEAKGLGDVKIGLSFDEDEDDDAEYEDRGDVDKAATIINKLVKYLRTILENINKNHIIMKFNKDVIETNKSEIEELKKKCEVLKKKSDEVDMLKEKLANMEQHSDEIQQRTMKGNLIVSSPNTQGKDSLMVKRERKENGRVVGLEDETEMIVRLIRDKTGVNVPLCDITACHAINKQGANSSYVVRIHNRKPGSAWEVLAAGLMTGKNFKTGDYFTGANVFLNFQLTKRRGDLAKEVRKAKYSKDILKYGTDQNGRITVRVNVHSVWAEVTSVSHLRHLVTNPPVTKTNRGAWGGQQQQ